MINNDIDATPIHGLNLAKEQEEDDGQAAADDRGVANLVDAILDEDQRSATTLRIAPSSYFN